MISHRPLEDWEYPEPDVDEEEDVVETRECPTCGADVYEESERCPVCGEFVKFANSALAGQPWWFLVIGLIGILAVIVALI